MKTMTARRGQAGAGTRLIQLRFLAHARSGDPIAIAAYVGTGDVLDRAIADFAQAYAEQNDLDHAALQEAADSARIPVSSGL